MCVIPRTIPEIAAVLRVSRGGRAVSCVAEMWSQRDLVGLHATSDSVVCTDGKFVELPRVPRVTGITLFCVYLVRICPYLTHSQLMPEVNSVCMGPCSRRIHCFFQCGYFCCHGNPQWSNHPHCQQCRPKDHTCDSSSAQGEQRRGSSLMCG